MAVQHQCNEITLPTMPPTAIANPTVNSTNETVTSSLMPPSSSTPSQSLMPDNFMTNASASIWQSIEQSNTHPPARKTNSKLNPREQEIWKTSLKTQQHRVNNKKNKKNKARKKQHFYIWLRDNKAKSTKQQQKLQRQCIAPRIPVFWVA